MICIINGYGVTGYGVNCCQFLLEYAIIGNIFMTTLERHEHVIYYFN